MNRLIQALLAAFLMITGAVIMLLIMKGSDLQFRPNPDVASSDFVSIVLSAIGVMLTAVTVLLGALAIIGWATFEARVSQSAEIFLERRFSEKDPRYIKMVEDLQRASLKGMTPEYRDENNSPFPEDAV